MIKIIIFDFDGTGDSQAQPFQHTTKNPLSRGNAKRREREQVRESYQASGNYAILFTFIVSR